MIETRRQYEVAKQQAARLEAGLEQLLVKSPETVVADPVLLNTAHAGVRHVLAELHAEIADYESRMGHARGAHRPTVPPR